MHRCRAAVAWLWLLSLVCSIDAWAEDGEPEAAASEDAPASDRPDEDAPTGEASPDVDARAQAKELFRRGVGLFEVKSYDRALSMFLRSRRLFASVQNTTNAAITLDRLGRYDEALELYEELLLSFEAQLSDRDRKAIGPAMDRLRKKVGQLDVSSNVSGLLVVDGRPRGRLPRTTPLPLIGGRHVVRVIKDGYGTFEQRVDITIGQTTALDAALTPLASAGRLRIEDREGAALTAFVDGAPMGPTPWEGTLGPGPHVVSTRLDDRGSAPTVAVVVQGQTATVVLPSTTLSEGVRLEVSPAEAALTLELLDDATANARPNAPVPLGQGSYRGRLPPGRYRVSARENGYHPETRVVVVQAGQPTELSMELRVHSDHPRWPRPLSGTVEVAAFGGVGFASTLDADAEESCTECPSTPGVLVVLLGGRAGLSVSLWDRFGGLAWLSPTPFGLRPGHPAVRYAVGRLSLPRRALDPWTLCCAGR